MPGNSSGRSTSWRPRLQATMQVHMRQRQCADSASHRSKDTCNNYAECATGLPGIRVNHCAKRPTSSCSGRSSKSTQSQTAKGWYQGCDYSKSSTGFSPPSSRPRNTKGATAQTRGAIQAVGNNALSPTALPSSQDQAGLGSGRAIGPLHRLRAAHLGGGNGSPRRSRAPLQGH